MRLLLTLIMAFGVCLTSFGAATWPASTNGNNTFFGNNTFKTPTTLYGATVTNAGNTAYLYISANSGIGGLTGVIESTPSGMVLSGDTGLGNSIQISPLGVLSGNGSGLTSLTLPDPMTLNQLNLNTLILTNPIAGTNITGASTITNGLIGPHVFTNHTDVLGSALTSGDVMGWNAATGKWTNGPPSAGGSQTPWTSDIDANSKNVTNINSTALKVLTIATLPASPIAGQTAWASDVVTSRGIGDFCYYNGTNWLTRENVIATTDIPTFIVNSHKAGLNLVNPISQIQSMEIQESAGTMFTYGGPIYTAHGANGAASGGGIANIISDAQGLDIYLYTGTDLFGNDRLWSSRIAAFGAGNFYSCFANIYPENLVDGTDNYWVTFGMASTTTSNAILTGAYFIYDRQNSLGIVSNATFTANWTNNWIAANANSSSYQYTDTGLPVITTAGATSLGLICTTTATIYYTNNVACCTNTTAGAIPAATLYTMNIKLLKTAGTNGRKVHILRPYIHIRHAERTPW